MWVLILRQSKRVWALPELSWRQLNKRYVYMYSITWASFASSAPSQQSLLGPSQQQITKEESDVKVEVDTKNGQDGAEEKVGSSSTVKQSDNTGKADNAEQVLWFIHNLQQETATNSNNKNCFDSLNFRSTYNAQNLSYPRNFIDIIHKWQLIHVASINLISLTK